MSEPQVGIIMGCRSDWETMRHAADTLEAPGTSHEVKVVSAHRTPKRLYDYAANAEARGLKLIIAGAGGAAHLPGMAAAMTALPVLGVPVESKALKGMDSLLSIVQMPAGIPVGTLAIGSPAQSTPGARRSDPRQLGRGACARLDAYRETDRRSRYARMIVAPGCNIGIIGGGPLGRMLQGRGGAGYDCKCSPDATPAAGLPPTTRAAMDVAALRKSPKRSMSPLRIENLRRRRWRTWRQAKAGPSR